MLRRICRSSASSCCNERGPLGRIPVGEKCLKLIGRGEQALDVEIGAPGERRVAHELGGKVPCPARYAATNRSTGVDQSRQTSAGTARSLERQRGLPFRRRRGRRQSIACTFVNPRADGGDFPRGERRSVQRHRRCHFSRDPLHQKAAGRVARPDGRTAAASVESRLRTPRARARPSGARRCGSSGTSPQESCGPGVDSRWLAVHLLGRPPGTL